MVKKTMYDPWQSITTRNGYCCDEVISEEYPTCK